MTDNKITPQGVKSVLEEVLKTAEATRLEMLERFSKDGMAEAAALRREKKTLLKTVAPDDPRVLSLDRRTAGVMRGVDLAETSLRTEKFTRKIGAKDWAVMGRVIDPKGRPVPGIHVELSDKGSPLGGRRKKILTDRNGEFYVRFTAKEFRGKSQIGVTLKTKEGKILHRYAQLIQPGGNQIFTFDIRLRRMPDAKPDAKPDDKPDDKDKTKRKKKSPEQKKKPPALKKKRTTPKKKQSAPKKKGTTAKRKTR